MERFRTNTRKYFIPYCGIYVMATYFERQIHGDLGYHWLQLWLLPLLITRNISEILASRKLQREKSINHLPVLVSELPECLHLSIADYIILTRWALIFKGSCSRGQEYIWFIVWTSQMLSYVIHVQNWLPLLLYRITFYSIFYIQK